MDSFSIFDQLKPRYASEKAADKKKKNMNDLKSKRGITINRMGAKIGEDEEQDSL